MKILCAFSENLPCGIDRASFVQKLEITSRGRKKFGQAERMGLPKPLGKYMVSFGDFELHRINAKDAPNSPYAPPFWVFYPTNARQPSACKHLGSRAWLQNLHYTWGYCCTMMPPKNIFRQMILWIMASTIHVMVRPWSAIHATIGSQLLPPASEEEEGHLPVIIFSHGLWACRTTYSALCCDLASHGYVVAAVEHLDGSAQMARYIDNNGKKNWLPYSYINGFGRSISMDDRAQQLNTRSKEIIQVVDILENLDHELLTQGSNVATGKTKLDVTSLLHRLDLNHLVVAGHLFGGATVVLVSGLDHRVKCCLGLDVWWDPLDSKKIEINDFAPRVPMILINTETFNSASLRRARSAYMNGRLAAESNAPPVTEMKTIKGAVHQNQLDFPLVLNTCQDHWDLQDHFLRIQRKTLTIELA